MNYCKNVRTYTLHLKPIIFEHSANHDQWDGPLASHDQAVHNEDNDKVSDSHAHPDIEQQHDVLDIGVSASSTARHSYFVSITNILTMDLIQLSTYTCFSIYILIVIALNLSTGIVVLFNDIFDWTTSELVTGHLIRHPEQSSNIAGKGRLGTRS